MNKVRDNLWRYWGQFVLVHCFCYIQLYAAIRNGDWELRTSALKSMAPLFIAFDQDVYMHIVPHHLNETSKYPPFYSGMFKVRWVHYKSYWATVVQCGN